MAVRAKFRCTSITLTQGSRPKKNPDGTNVTGVSGGAVYESCEMKTLVLNPIYDSDANSENRKFWDSSPGGKLELNCVNPGASDQFKVGQDYYIDFTPAN